MAPRPADLTAKDYYRILGVDRETTDADIAKAYKKLALKYHPDKNPENKENAEATFKKVTEAYEVLRDSEKRKRYDMYGLDGQQGSDFGGHSGVSRSHADDIFNAFFGGGKGGDLFGSPNGPGDPFGFFGEGARGEGERFVFDFGTGMPGRGGHQSRASPPAHAKPPCTAVVVRGLTKSPGHNGKSGEICRWDEARERYDVQLEGGTTLSLRPQSVIQLCAVEVIALESKPELNGSRGRIFNFDEARGRYMVHLDCPAIAVALQPANCVLLEHGVRVLLQGLSSSPHLNGQMAQVHSVERAASRYTVCCQGGRYIKVKFDNVIC